MTDRELLELAAKAAGLKDARWDNDYNAISYTAENGLKNCPWNPLKDDGEALRLAVRLSFLVHIDRDGGTVRIISQEVQEPMHLWSPDYDPETITRRAIVRAAAEIGKGMK